ncbi:MAG: polysaccharide export protein [Cyanobium sp. CACIAM 14]|nr:MAG: polysaccharide export protein [Cyanobium sp. CACIAM 14]
MQTWKRVTRVRSLGRRGLQCIAGAVLQGTILASGASALPLSPGDRIKISIVDGEEFSGIYEVSIDGKIEIPYLAPLSVVGLEPEKVKEKLRRELISGRFFQPSFLRIGVNVVKWAPIGVFIAGEVFLPGRVMINEKAPEEAEPPPIAVTGQYSPNRFLSVALRFAGGIKPTADVASIRLIRNGKETSYDFSGFFTGEPTQDVPLIAGDQVVVPSTGQVNNALVRPSPITMTGVKIFISNLTVPATGNAISGISRDATSFSYGSRFSQAVVAGNCAGGTRFTNAGRYAILVRTNERTGETKYLERKVDSLLMHSRNDADNPYLMNNDSVACYDSGYTTLRDIIRTIGEVVTPVGIIQNW